MLVGILGVVLLGHVVEEEAVRQRLVAVRVDARDVDADGIVVADVLGERLAALPVEHDDAHHPVHAQEEIVLPALVEVQPAHDPASRRDEVGLAERLRERPGAHQLREPAPLVLEPPERDPEDALDQATLLTPVRAIKAPISGSDSCVPASSHQPVTRCEASTPRSA